jgi:hypothetical protein
LTSKIDQVLEILGDGEWHNLMELQDEIGVSNGRVLEILGFLSKYEFVKIDFAKEKARITKNAQEFMAQNATL